MFSKAEKGKPAPPPQAVQGAPSIISANLHIVGNLETGGEIQVDGIVDGDVSTTELTVGAKATINGEIAANRVVVRGTVNGRIRAETVELAATARVNGDIWHKSLAVEAGAYLDGHCKRIESDEDATGEEVSLFKGKDPVRPVGLGGEPEADKEDGGESAAAG